MRFIKGTMIQGPFGGSLMPHRYIDIWHQPPVVLSSKGHDKVQTSFEAPMLRSWYSA